MMFSLCFYEIFVQFPVKYWFLNPINLWALTLLKSSILYVNPFYAIIRRCEREQQERKEFILNQKAVLREYMRKEGALLAQKREVKRLSDLIMLELKVRL